MGQSNENTLSRSTQGDPSECWCNGSQSIRDYQGNPTFPDELAASRRGWNPTRYAWCPCERAQDERARYLRLWRAKVAERKERFADQSQIPLRFWGMKLADSPARFANPELVRGLEHPEDELESSWYLWGDTGRGKTGLAVAYAMDVLRWDDPDEMPSSVLYWPVPRLLRAIRSSFGDNGPASEAEIFKACRETSLLVLDDIGTERPTEWMRETLYEIVSARHEQRSATFFTSNLSIAELNTRIGDRTTWRILEMCGAENIAYVTGPNLRDVAS